MHYWSKLTPMTIRHVLSLGVAALLAVTAPAQTPTAKPAPGLTITTVDPAHLTGAPPNEVQLLWPQGAPGALGTADVDKPKILIYLPKENPTHMGVIVAPGGGYQHLSAQHEGADIAHWLNDHGIAAFVLQYRLGPQYHHPIELGDAQRALRLVRSRADEFGITKLGMWGFSAGGHLTATAGTHFDAGNPTATDPIDRQTSRPDFLVLAYAVVTLTPPYDHGGSLKALLGDNPDPALVDLLSDEKQVTAQTPPTFIYATTDDHSVPVMNSIMFYEALIKAGVPAEMHIFQHGAHGSGLGQGSPSLAQWPGLLWTWLQTR
jgi:acetyl esterase/lipase